MISLETFTKSLATKEISKLNFTYESKEYLIAREEDEDGSSVFLFADEKGEPLVFPTARELTKNVTLGGEPLQDVWKFVVPICDDTLLDGDYIETVYGDSLGKIMCSAAGTTSHHDRYLTQYLIPSLIFCGLVLVALLLSTVFVSSLTWTIFGISSAIVVVGFAVTQVIFISNTKKYRQGNPCAHCYLLTRGAVIVTDRYEFAIPYEKIIRLDTEAGIQITTLRTVFTFIADHGNEITESLKSIYAEIKSIKKVFWKKGKKKKKS